MQMSRASSRTSAVISVYLTKGYLACVSENMHVTIYGSLLKGAHQTAGSLLLPHACRKNASMSSCSSPPATAAAAAAAMAAAGALLDCHQTAASSSIKQCSLPNTGPELLLLLLLLVPP